MTAAGHLVHVAARRNEHSIATGAFGLVHGGIRSVNELLQTLSSICRRDTETDRHHAHECSAVAAVDLAHRNGEPQALGQRSRIAQTGIGKQNGELLTAEPREDSRALHVLLKGPCNGLQHPVAQQVSMHVIDTLEVVKVCHEQGRTREICPVLLQNGALKSASIEESGQRILQRLGLCALELLGQPLHLPRAGLELIGRLQNRPLHPGGLADHLVDHGPDILDAGHRPQLHPFGGKVLAELRRIRSGHLDGFGGFLQQLVQPLVQALQQLHVAGRDMPCMQPVHLLLIQRPRRFQPLLEHLAQRRIDARDMFVPQRIADRMQAGNLSRHERQCQPQEFTAVLFGFSITHGSPGRKGRQKSIATPSVPTTALFTNVTNW